MPTNWIIAHATYAFVWSSISKFRPHTADRDLRVFMAIFNCLNRWNTKIHSARFEPKDFSCNLLACCEVIISSPYVCLRRMNPINWSAEHKRTIVWEECTLNLFNSHATTKNITSLRRPRQNKWRFSMPKQKYKIKWLKWRRSFHSGLKCQM